MTDRFSSLTLVWNEWKKREQSEEEEEEEEEKGPSAIALQQR
jgi:hypothetical protein